MGYIIKKEFNYYICLFDKQHFKCKHKECIKKWLSDHHSKKKTD